MGGPEFPPTYRKCVKVFEREILGLDFGCISNSKIGALEGARLFLWVGVVKFFGLGAEGFADLPVVAEGVDDAAYAPGVLGSYGADDGGAGGDCAVEGGFGVFDG